MKKIYIQPQVKETKVVLQQMIAESIGLDPSQFFDPTESLAKDPVEDFFGNEDFGAGEDFGNETWGGADEW